ncbi:hypothetical protein B0J14DRAFT_567556 [Halenospora varia]|nr:hypothetical protein B0J14DRAFT_567556 [Halenospora varia]
MSNRVFTPLTTGAVAGDNFLATAATGAEDKIEDADKPLRSNASGEVTETEAQEPLTKCVDELAQFELTAPPDLKASEVKDLFTEAKMWLEMGEHEFGTTHRPTDFEENGPQSAESIGNQLAIVNWSLSMTLVSDTLDPIAPVWKSESDENEFVDTLVKKYKEEGLAAMYDHISNFYYSGGRLPRATSCGAVIEALGTSYEEKGGAGAA